MSLGDARISETKAKKAAEKELRRNIGNLPHLGSPDTDGNSYSFPILISTPHVIFDQTDQGKQPVEVRFMSDVEVGRIIVDSDSAEIRQATERSDVQKNIREEKEAVEKAVQKALLKGAAEELSMLSYPKHRQTPAINVLSEIIINGEIEESSIPELVDKYEDHINTLVDVGLIKRANGTIRAADPLTQIIHDHSKPYVRLNEALAYLFRKKADDLAMMNDFLGPHLEIAAYYYKQAIISEDLPRVSLEEFRREISARHGGKTGDKRSFKVARYLIQLEEVGLIKVDYQHGNRVWKGYSTIKDDLMEHNPLGQQTILG